MKLRTAQVEKFKCIKDSTVFKIDEKVTCLVGKNEAGKTAIFEALQKLNPVEKEDADFDDLREYPRLDWPDYKLVKAKTPANVLTTTWELESADIDAVRELVGEALSSTTVGVTKGYANKSYWDVRVDEPKVVGHVLDGHDLLDTEKTELQGAQSVKELIAKLKGLKEASELQTGLLESLTTDFGDSTATQAVINLLHARMPRIAYFSRYHTMSGEVALEDFKRRKANPTNFRPADRVFEAFLGLIGMTPEGLQDIKEFERLQAELEGASGGISKKIFAYWSQNRQLRVQVRFDHALPGDAPPLNEGYIVRTRIENTRHGSSTSFDDRSTGFVWFFSFLVWYGQVRRTYGENLIILLDEPGLSLHAKAQADLLRYFEEQLAPHYQVLYSTHSPFMVDPANLLRARTVEDVYVPPKEPDGVGVEVGTVVGDDILSTDRDTVFPLQACLGYEITQTLFVGKHNLLVEGPSDVLYIKWFQRKLAALGRMTLDPRWTAVPCGGITKVAAFMSLFRGNALNVAVLTDIKQGEKAEIERIRKARLLKDGHVLTADMFSGKREADTEDIFGNDAFVSLVNKTYGLGGANAARVPSGADAAKRILEVVETHMRALPPESPEFDHFRPSEYLTESGLGLQLDGLDAALDNFQKLFEALNPLLTA